MPVHALLAYVQHQAMTRDQCWHTETCQSHEHRPLMHWQLTRDVRPASGPAPTQTDAGGMLISQSGQWPLGHAGPSCIS